MEYAYKKLSAIRLPPFVSAVLTPSTVALPRSVTKTAWLEAIGLAKPVRQVLRGTSTALTICGSGVTAS